MPKITVITRKAYGGAYCVMASKHIRTDFNYAWPSAEIAVMGPEGAVNILYKREIEKARRSRRRCGRRRSPSSARSSPIRTSRPTRGFIDEVILPRETRAQADSGAGARSRPSATRIRRRSTATFRFRPRGLVRSEWRFVSRLRGCRCDIRGLKATDCRSAVRTVDRRPSTVDRRHSTCAKSTISRHWPPSARINSGGCPA